MKIKNLIDQLSSYKPDEEVIVAYWDKSIVEGYADVTLTDENWIDIVAEYDAHEPIEFEMFGEKLQEIAMEVGSSVCENCEESSCECKECSVCGDLCFPISHEQGIRICINAPTKCEECCKCGGHS